MFRIQRMRSVGTRNRTVGVAGYAPTWTPAKLSTVAPSLDIALARSRNLLFQDVGKTTLATANGDLVYVQTCPYTGYDWVAPSAGQRPTLTNISGSKWGLTCDLATGGLTGPTQSAQASACTFSLRASETAATGTQRIIQDTTTNALICPRRTSLSAFAQGTIFGGQLTTDANAHTTTMIKASAGANWALWFDTVSQSVTANAFQFGRLALARGGIQAEGFAGIVSAFITASSALSTSNRSLLETYVATTQ